METALSRTGRSVEGSKSYVLNSFDVINSDCYPISEIEFSDILGIFFGGMATLVPPKVDQNGGWLMGSPVHHDVLKILKSSPSYAAPEMYDPGRRRLLAEHKPLGFVIS